MEQLFSRPEIQSAVVPFILGLAVSAGFRKVTVSAWIWALFAAFLAAALLINGATLTPLTGTRKIILLVLGGFVVAALLPGLIRKNSLQSSIASGLPLLAVLWVFWAVVARREATGIVLFLAGATALVLALAWGLDRTRASESRLHAAGLPLMLGTGLASTAGSSALLGQLGLALAAASGGAFLAWVLLGSGDPARRACGPLAILPYLMPAVLIALAASVFARLPWYALVPLAAIPFATSLVPFKSESRFLAALIHSLPGLVIAAATAFWVWQTGSSGSSGY